MLQYIAFLIEIVTVCRSNCVFRATKWTLVCTAFFGNTVIQTSRDRKRELQCIYCKRGKEVNLRHTKRQRELWAFLIYFTVYLVHGDLFKLVFVRQQLYYP